MVAIRRYLHGSLYRCEQYTRFTIRSLSCSYGRVVVNNYVNFLVNKLSHRVLQLCRRGLQHYLHVNWSCIWRCYFAASIPNAAYLLNGFIDVQLMSALKHNNIFSLRLYTSQCSRDKIVQNLGINFIWSQNSFAIVCLRLGFWIA
jgi:hypothetical protein